MTQLQITAFGDPSVLKLNPSLDKVPADGEVRVRICFAGVNPIDAKTRAGLGWAAAQNKDKLPWTPGYDVSGVVEKVGLGVTSLVEGDRVCGMDYGSAAAEPGFSPSGLDHYWPAAGGVCPDRFLYGDAAEPYDPL